MRDANMPSKMTAQNLSAHLYRYIAPVFLEDVK